MSTIWPRLTSATRMPPFADLASTPAWATPSEMRPLDAFARTSPVTSPIVVLALVWSRRSGGRGMQKL
ncbi:hypothetical protein [Streptomyces melanogenes]|uniref:Uncharacterized protein n=1 Tax=Streptomyces melanogenes TaxID=67326 RepID=A0ABZ1XFW1_9ACTN|nr:hypothetical protein [Streptomyces melanogenes]